MFRKILCNQDEGLPAVSLLRPIGNGGGGRPLRSTEGFLPRDDVNVFLNAIMPGADKPYREGREGGEVVNTGY
jgi:hypothetical protein